MAHSHLLILLVMLVWSSINICHLLSTSLLFLNHIFFYHSASVSWNNLLSHSRQLVHHVTPSPILNSTISDLSTIFAPFVFYLSCIYLGYISGLIYPVLTRLCLFISDTFRYHSPSCHSCQCLCYLTCKCLWISIVINVFTSLGTRNLLHFTPVFVFISSPYHIIY